MKYQFIPVLIFFASMLVPICVALWVRFQRRNRRTPLTVQLLRAPGESLYRVIEKISEDIDSYFAILTMLPLMIFATYLSVKYLGNQMVSWQLFTFLCLISVIPCAYKLFVDLKKRHNLCLGLDCERAVGQELDQLMLDGYRVYHDFPAENFNIDHIVIGANGVFAVETKGRAKLLKGEAKIIYDGQGLQFPTHYEREPFDQARRQADWLAKWLTSAVGDQVGVKPVLVFPGWYIERKKPGLLIYNGKSPRSVYKNAGGLVLSAEMIQRIAHQVEQRCRDVGPVAYKKAKLNN